MKKGISLFDLIKRFNFIFLLHFLIPALNLLYFGIAFVHCKFILTYTGDIIIVKYIFQVLYLIQL